MISAASRGAMSVLLNTLGWTAPRPRRPLERTAALRRWCRGAGPGGADIGYLVAGDPRAARVLLVHGTPGAAEGWTDYLLAPPPGAEVLAIDRPGFGRSAPQRAVTSLAAQAAAVSALLPRDGRLAVLVGHSLGGSVAARVAAEQPRRVGALVLLAAALDPRLERVHALQRVAAWPLLRALLPRAIRNANAELTTLGDELLELSALLGRIRAPVLIVHGDADALVPVANAAFARARLSAARCCCTRLLPGQNHFLPWQAEREVRQAIGWALAAAC